MERNVLQVELLDPRGGLGIRLEHDRRDRSPLCQLLGFRVEEIHRFLQAHVSEVDCGNDDLGGGIHRFARGFFRFRRNHGDRLIRLRCRDEGNGEFIDLEFQPALIRDLRQNLPQGGILQTQGQPDHSGIDGIVSAGTPGLPDHKIHPLLCRVFFNGIELDASQPYEIDDFLHRRILELHEGDDDGIEFPFDRGAPRIHVFNLHRPCDLLLARFLGAGRSEKGQETDEHHPGRPPSGMGFAMRGDFPDARSEAGATLEDADEAKTERPGGGGALEFQQGIAVVGPTVRGID